MEDQERETLCDINLTFTNKIIVFWLTKKSQK